MKRKQERIDGGSSGSSPEEHQYCHIVHTLHMTLKMCIYNVYIVLHSVTKKLCDFVRYLVTYSNSK